MSDGTETPRPADGRARALWRFVPLVAFAALGAVFGYRLLTTGPEDDVSFLVNRAAPTLVAYSLEQALAADAAGLDASEDPTRNADAEGAPPPAIGDAVLRSGQVTIVNFWASYCLPCRAEHPRLMTLAQSGRVSVVGVAVQDEPRASHGFLSELGNPFDHVAVDRRGDTSLKWGVEALPETFIVAGDGTVIYKHTGVINPGDLERYFLPAIARAEERGG